MPDLDLDELRRLAEEHRDGDSFRARLARGVLALLGRSESEQRQRERAERELDEAQRKAAAWDALARTGGTGSTPAVTRDDLIDRLERELAEARAELEGHHGVRRMTDLDLAELRRLAEAANSALLGTSHDAIKATRYLLNEACDPATVLALLAIADRVQTAERERDDEARRVEHLRAIAHRELDQARRERDEARGELAEARAELERLRGEATELRRGVQYLTGEVRHLRGEVRDRVRALPRHDLEMGDRSGAEMVPDDLGDWMSADDVLEAIGGGDGE